MNLMLALSTFGLIFLAEMGDKTQIVSMILATRFDWKRAFLGIAAAFALINVLGVAVGKVLFTFIPVGWIRLLAAALFLIFGFTTLKDRNDDDDDDEGASSKKDRGPFLTSFLMIFLAEMGDKTQLATSTMAAQNGSTLGNVAAVFVGSTLALWLVSLLGMLVGTAISKRISVAKIKTAGGVAFLLFGCTSLIQGLSLLQIIPCPLGLICGA